MLSDTKAATAAISVRSEFLRSIGEALTDRRVRLAVKDIADPVDVTIRELSISPEPGIIPVAIDLGAKAGSSKAIDIEVEGFLYFGGTTMAKDQEDPDDPVAVATFKVMPVSTVRTIASFWTSDISSQVCSGASVRRKR